MVMSGMILLTLAHFSVCEQDVGVQDLGILGCKRGKDEANMM